MSLDRFLNHRVSIVRENPVRDGLGDPTYDAYGAPIRTPATVETDVPAGIQPRSATERPAVSEAGVVVADHEIYLRPRALSTADAIVHDPATCPVRVDLPAATFQITFVDLESGAGHHLKVDAQLVVGELAQAAAGS